MLTPYSFKAEIHTTSKQSEIKNSSPTTSFETVIYPGLNVSHIEHKSFVSFETLSIHNEHLNSLNNIIQALNTTTEHKDVITSIQMKKTNNVKVIYENINTKKSNKLPFKIIHKCKYPGCHRMFISSGWLKVHLSEHLKEMAKSKFNVLFDRLIHGNLN